MAFSTDYAKKLPTEFQLAVLFYALFLLKCSLSSLITTGESRNTPTKLGTAINPLNVSEIPQIKSRLTVAPTMEMREYAM